MKSYTAQVKSTLLSVRSNRCCKTAELFGFLQYSREYSDRCARAVADSAELRDRVLKLLAHFAPDAAPRVFEHGSARRTYEIRIENGGLPSAPPDLTDRDCCKAAFLRGAFLASGCVSDPGNAYRAEILVRAPERAAALVEALEALGVHPHQSHRGKNALVYVKSADDVKTFLALIGAKAHIFDYINAEIEKNIRNDINRAMNCENANLNKMVLASEQQAAAIEKLKAAGYPGMSAALVEIAELRLQNRELTLEQLGQMASPPLSKSGVSHRLKKITELAKTV